MKKVVKPVDKYQSRRKTPAWVENDPRVIAARERLARGELSYGRLADIRYAVAGICSRCSKPSVSRGVCKKHLPAERRKHEQFKAQQRERIRVAKNTAAGVDPNAYSVKSCALCGALRRNKSTCKNGVH